MTRNNSQGNKTMNTQAIIKQIKGYLTVETFFLSGVFAIGVSAGYVLMHFVSKYW